MGGKLAWEVDKVVYFIVVPVLNVGFFNLSRVMVRDFDVA
jgi:hypothetical protein